MLSNNKIQLLQEVGVGSGFDASVQLFPPRLLTQRTVCVTALQDLSCMCIARTTTLTSHTDINASSGVLYKCLDTVSSIIITAIHGDEETERRCHSPCTVQYHYNYYRIGPATTPLS
jgi:hypothetical protein